MSTKLIVLSLLLFAVVVAVVAVANIATNKSELQPTPESLELVAAHGTISVFIVTISNQQYIIARDHKGLAICPSK